MFLSAMDQTVVSTALPTIVGDLRGGSHLTCLMVGAQTIVSDIVSPRERGRYMGLFMAMFGVTTVLGRLVGGLSVDYASWRWIFYINIPIGILAPFVTTTALPNPLTRVKQVIDYLGTALLAGAATAFVLYTSLGGTEYPWGAPFMIVLLLGGVVLTVAWVFAERRASEPIIPLRLFGNKVFSSASAIGFVVGFSMFGALSFLPLYFQVVKGVTPTSSGLRLFPMMARLLVASIGSGQIVSPLGPLQGVPGRRYIPGHPRFVPHVPCEPDDERLDSRRLHDRVRACARARDAGPRRRRAERGSV
jgi:MFS family permease